MQDSENTQLTPYGLWQRSEGIPIHVGLSLDEVKDLPLGIWPRKGIKGAFINMEGSDEALGAHICEIPPGGNTNPERYMFEEAILVLQGSGSTTVWTDEGAEQSFEWGEGALFSPPINIWRKHVNSSGTVPVKFMVISNAPVIMNLFRSEDFIFNNSYVFAERYRWDQGYFAGSGESVLDPVRKRLMWKSGLIPNVRTFEPKRDKKQYGGIPIVFMNLSGNSIVSHIAEIPIGVYMPSHRHGPGAHIFVLEGEGFSLFWREGEGKEKLYWKAGSLMSPPDMIFHQHFNTGAVQVKHLAFHYGGWRMIVQRFSGENVSIRQGGHLINYADEDREILETFKAELAKKGKEPKPLASWHE